ncbi:MAG: sulfatase-like hydrolase/transferase [Armatimonadetes bacterium]|nr:sulfatase-like hydrolase/transferase [Armatimonadota bacterium]
MNPATRRAAPAPAGWVNSLGLAFSAVTWVVAQPLYGRISDGPGLRALIPSVLTVHILPTVGVFVLDRAIARADRRGAWLRSYRTVLIAAALVSLLRMVQAEYFPNAPELSVGRASRSAVMFAAVAASAGTALVAYRFVQWLFVFLAPLLLLSTVHFAYQEGVAVGAAPAPVPQVRLARATPATGPVFILILDALGRDVLLKNGEIDGSRFPALKSLAARGVWFSNATSNYPDTCHSIPSMLTGEWIFPENRDCVGEARAPGTPDLLVALSQQYRLSLYEEYMDHCFPGAFRCRGVSYLVRAYPHRALGRYFLPGFRPASLKSLLGADAFHAYTLVLFEKFLADVRAGRGRGYAYYFHSQVSHQPYVFTESGGSHRSPYVLFYGDRGDRPGHDARAQENYERQAMFADRLLARFLRKLRQEGVLNTATIIVTSDHGPTVTEPVDAGGGTEARRLFSAHVPLLIVSPTVRPGVLQVDYQHIDFLPTVLDVLGVRLERPVQGVSVFAPARPTRRKAFVWGDRRWYAVDPASGIWRPSEEPARRD